MEDEKNIDNYSTYFDSLVSGKNIQIIKTLIPFMPPNSQKILSVMVKVTELQNTIRLVNSPSIRAAGIHINGTGKNLSDMLEAMKKFLSPQDVEMIDMFMTIMELGKMNEDAQGDMLKEYMEMFTNM